MGIESDIKSQNVIISKGQNIILTQEEFKESIYFLIKEQWEEINFETIKLNVIE